MTKILNFKDIWPHRVVIRREVSWNDALYWLDCRADMMKNEDFTTFTFKEFGFKDKKLAMEFKLRFG